MRVTVHAKPGAKAKRVEELPDGSLRVSVRAPPVDGKANDAIIGALAEYFRVKKSDIVLRSGASSRTKHFEVQTRA